MIASKELSLCFKGSREYIQGTNMLDAAMEAIAHRAQGMPIENLNFSISKMTGKKLVCDWWEKGSPAPDHGKPIVTCLFNLGDVPYEGRLVETEDDVKERVPFDESVITSRCVFTPAESLVKLVETPSDVTPIEILVSMNKALHYKVFTIPSDSQWVFCRWESAVWPLPDEMRGISLTIEQSLGTRLTRARVELNDALIGRIYFSARNAGA